MGFFDSVGGSSLLGTVLGGASGGLSTAVAPTLGRLGRKAINQVGTGGVLDKAAMVAAPGAYLASAGGIGAYRGYRNGTGAVGGAVSGYGAAGAIISGKAGGDSLPPVVDPAIDQQTLSDNAAAYRAARRRQMLAGAAASGTSLTGPGGLGDSSGGTAKTLLGA